MMQMRTFQNNKGFTLVELAIVLVIIGILLGGIIKGQDLIKNAKYKRLYSTYREIIAGTYTYYDRYGKYPGDDNTVVTRWGTGVNGNANGAGKSTLLYHLNGTLIGEGRVEILGLLAEKKNLREIRRRVGVVFQNPEDQLFCPTVFDDVAFGPLNLGLAQEEVKRLDADSEAFLENHLSPLQRGKYVLFQIDFYRMLEQAVADLRPQWGTAAPIKK